MQQAAPEIVKQLEDLLVREGEHYRRYLKLLVEERSVVTRFNAEKLQQVTLKRAELYDKLRACHAERLEIMRAFPESLGSNLRTVITHHFPPQDARRLLPRCEELRGLVGRVNGDSLEHSQIVQFGLKVVHGVLSILWSATRSVLNSYDRRGGLHISYQPVKSRLDGVLKRA